MKDKALGLRVAGVLFLFAAAAHIVRLVKGWNVQVGPYSIAPWVSVVGVVVLVALAVAFLMLACCKKADEVVAPKA